jgi:hypothetical protein
MAPHGSVGWASSRGYTTAASPDPERVRCRGRRRAWSWVLPQLLIPGRTRIADRRLDQMPHGWGTFVDARGCTGIRDTGGAELVLRIDLHGPAPPRGRGLVPEGEAVVSWERNRPYAPLHRARNRLKENFRNSFSAGT